MASMPVKFFFSGQLASEKERLSPQKAPHPKPISGVSSCYVTGDLAGMVVYAG